MDKQTFNGVLELASKIQDGSIALDDKRLEKAENILAKMFATEDGRMEIASLITEYIEDYYNKFDISPLIFKTKRFKLGEEALFKTHKKGIVAYETAPNAYVPKSQNYETEYTMTFTNLGVRPTALLQDLKTGRLSSLAELIKDGQTAVDEKRMEMVWELLAQTYNATSNKENYFKTNTVNQTSLDAAINRVRKVTGGRPTIIADYDLLTEIEKFDGFKALEPVYNEVRENGLLGMYRGCKLIYLPEIKNPVTQESAVPLDKIMVVGKDIGYAATKGDAIFEQSKDLDDLTWSCRYDKRVGWAITEPRGIAVVHVTDE